ncbi:MAG TPA: hypothetical protein ENF83_02680, partial [Candidatus Korarchaeota archaeon]|nr:hypothetical protein [Candidatus Korarchaeota archaeon]
RSLEIYVLVNGEVRRVTSNSQADVSPDVSPDGRMVVFSRGLPGQGFNLYLIDLQTGSEVRLTDGPHNDLDPSFSPDGSKVVFASDRDGEFSLYVVDVESGAVEQLLTQRCVPAGAAGPGGMICRDVPVRGIQPDWSADGRYIAFSGKAKDREDLDLFVYEVESGTLGALFTNPGSDSLNPAWTTGGSVLFEEAWPGVDYFEVRVIVREPDGSAVDIGVIETVSTGDVISGHPYDPVSAEWAATDAPSALSSLHPTTYVPSSPVILSDEVLPPVVEGQPYRHDLGAVGGAPPYTWSLTVTSHDGRLPDWLSFEGGVLSSDSARSVRDLTMSITVTDSLGQSYTGTYRLTVYPATGVRIGGPDYYVVWSGYSQTLDLTSVWPVSGGEPPYQCTFETRGGLSVTGPPESATLSAREDGALVITAVDSFDQARRKYVQFYVINAYGPKPEENALVNSACGVNVSEITREPFVFEGQPAYVTVYLRNAVDRYLSYDISLTVDGRPVRPRNVWSEVRDRFLDIHFTVPEGTLPSGQRAVRGAIRVAVQFDSTQVVSRTLEFWVHASDFPYLYGHHFENFEVDDISYDLAADVWYWLNRRGEICVEPFGCANDPLFELIYENIWRDLGENGVCFGMVLSAYKVASGYAEEDPENPCSPIPKPYAFEESLDVVDCNLETFCLGGPMLPYKRGRSLWLYVVAQHLYQHDFDKLARGLHAYAVSSREMVWELVDAVQSWKSRFEAGQEEGLLIVTMNPSLWKGHAVMAYDIEQLDDHTYRIWVYDPNSPFDPDSYSQNSRYILVDTRSGSYSFEIGGEVWSTGVIYATPTSELLGRPMEDLWGALHLLEEAIEHPGTAIELIIFSGGTIEQVSDEEGRVMLNPDGTFVADPDARPKGVYPVVTEGQSANSYLFVQMVNASTFFDAAVGPRGSITLG